MIDHKNLIYSIVKGEAFDQVKPIEFNHRPHGHHGHYGIFSPYFLTCPCGRWFICCASSVLDTFFKLKRGAMTTGGPEYLKGRQIAAFDTEYHTGSWICRLPGNLKMHTFQAIRSPGRIIFFHSYALLGRQFTRV
jgi:hypothetical protein